MSKEDRIIEDVEQLTKRNLRSSILVSLFVVLTGWDFVVYHESLFSSISGWFVIGTGGILLSFSIYVRYVYWKVERAVERARDKWKLACLSVQERFALGTARPNNGYGFVLHARLG